MLRKPVDAEKLNAEIGQLPGLGLEELRECWKRLYGRPAPKFFRRKLLVQAVAYQMQVEAYGGLSSATKRRGLREIAEAVRAGNDKAVHPWAADQAGHEVLCASPNMLGLACTLLGQEGRQSPAACQHSAKTTGRTLNRVSVIP